MVERKVYDENGNVMPEELVKAQEDFGKAIQLNQEGKYQEALPLLEEAKKVLNEQNFKEYYHLLLNHLVFASQNLKLWGKAARYADEMLVVFEKKFGKASKEYVENCLDIAQIYEMTNEFDKAENCYRSALAYAEKNNGKQSAAYLAQLNNIAATYFLRNNYKDALPLLKDALHICEKVKGKKNVDYALITENIGQCYVYMKDCSNAKPYLQEALALFKELKGSSSKEYQRTQKALSKCP